MIDTHTHMYYPEYGDPDEVMSRCLKSGICHMVLPNVNENTLKHLKDFHSRYPENTSMAIGIHPTDLENGWEEFIEKMEVELSKGEYAAIGEVGIDLYWDDSNLDNQKIAFERQLKLAEKFQLPVIIHSRNAFDETLEVIAKVKPSVPLIFHSFTGSTLDVENIRKFVTHISV